MIKTDLHIHTSDDPVDALPYTTIDVIDRAADLGFAALAITLHDRQRDVRDLTGYARERGIVLIPGVERTIRGRHVLLLNFPPAAESVENFDDLGAFKVRHPEGLIVAPHPFFPHPNCLRGLTHRYADLFDAVEVNALYTSGCDFNRAAIRWAQARQLPLVGNSDAHRLSILGRTFSLVESESDAGAICSAIKRGRVQVQTQPLSISEAATYFIRLIIGGVRSTQADRAVPEPA